MSRKTDTASALASILKAKRGPEAEATPPADAPVEPPPEPAPVANAAAPSPAASPPPAPPVAPPAIEPTPVQASRPKARGGKSSDKLNYGQCSIYLRKDTRKKVSRALMDLDNGQDFSGLVQELLEQWLASRT